MNPLHAPFPYFGGKRHAAPLIWPRFGQVKNYVEPFAGSLAVLLASPAIHKTETVNDTDGFIVNFWRAIQSDPESTAAWADWPVSEIDLEARHGWLVNRSDRLRWSLEDPDFYDPKIAGWWCYGLCSWIGSGWCLGQGPWHHNGAHIGNRQLAIGNSGQGINLKLPALGDSGQGIIRQLPALGNWGRGIIRQLPTDTKRHTFILNWFLALRDRLRHVRITCGDWSRVVKPSVTNRHGLTAIFLDPPYSSPGIAAGLYSQENNIAQSVATWCAAHGQDPALRIILCGYEGDYTLPGWTIIPGKAGSSYKRGTGHHRERLWLSPQCQTP